jgi:hypothetical protein
MHSLERVELDPGIAPYVETLRAAGIDTFESCEGGAGHAAVEPTVWFRGERSEGFRALAVCIEHKLPAYELRRTWTIQDGEPTGPIWELAFARVAA